MTEETKPNHTRIKGNVWLVRTQAGFRQALIKAFGREPKQDRYPVESWPKQYPAVVTLTVGYSGYHYVVANCLYPNDIETIKELL